MTDKTGSFVGDGVRPHDCNTEENKSRWQSVIGCQNETISSTKQLLLALEEAGLKNELPVNSTNEISEINKCCIYEDIFDTLQEKHSDEWVGNENFFEPVLKNVTEANNFYIETVMVTLIMTTRRIFGNIRKFLKDFNISKLFRINDNGMNKCYVIVSHLKPFWKISSLNNFIDGTKKLRLFDGQKRGFFLWVGLAMFFLF